jgi:hypothetical protein
MSYQIQYLQEHAMVLIIVPAVIEPNAAQSATREVIELIKQHHSTRVLCDASRMQLAMSVPDLYRIVELYHSEGMPYGTRIAIAVPQQRDDIEKLEIFGIAALNRGYTVRLFGDMEHARQWLLHEPAPLRIAPPAPVN